MDQRHIRTLLDRLNGHCVMALEAGAAFAAARGHYEVTVEHVALKLLESGGGDFDRLLHQLGIDLDALWQGLLDNLTRQRAGNGGKPAFSLLLFQWLERAWMASSLHRGEGQIRSGALLEALVEMAPMLPGTGFAVLDGLPVEKLRREFAALTAGSSENPAVSAPAKPAAPVGGAAPSGAGGSSLASFTIDITERAARGGVDPVLGRNDEIRQVVDILTRRRKNNPIIVGEPGVGKTALVEGLALRIAEGSVPEALKGVRLLTLDLGLLQAGAGVKGEFEKRLKNVIDEVKASATPIILFIDEAHTLIGAGGEAGMGDAANLLKPALARGELRTVAATTWSEYKKYFERDAALERRFQLVKVDEPSEQGAMVMLGGLKGLYQKHHGILITDGAIEAAVKLSSRYINGRYLPDKAIDLLDTAAARVRMGQAAVPAGIEADREHIAYLERRLAHLGEEAGEGLPVDGRLQAVLEQELAATRERLADAEQRWQAETALVARIRSKGSKTPDPDAAGNTKKVVALKKGSDPLRQQLREMQGEQPLVQAEVNAAAIAEVVSDWTGVPVGKMVKDTAAALLEFEDLVGCRVVGQQAAIAAIGRAIRSAKAGLRNPDAPLGVFLLAGPSGVGKTETALAIADQLFGGERFLVTINMSEYQEAHTVSQLKGSPPGYVGYGEGGVLTEAVRQRPYSVILLDEVEKAHPDVMNLFYQVFDRGFMRDGEGREIDFKNTVILMTSNLGAEAIAELATPPAEPEGPQEGEGSWQPPTLAALREAIQPALLRHFAPALLGRMQVVPYLPLDGEALQAIAALKLDQVAQRLHAAHGMELRCAPQVIAQLADASRQPETGARFINALIEQQLLPGVARSLLGFMIEDDMPDILSLEVDEQGELTCLFADRAAEPEEKAAVESSESR
ncbi:ClpV1 family T6SS ATPase [Desulfuromonas versatilis]|uniref:ClpV1 family T6SS ATPase n=1 Tax=Desulfuromonas versatilis TaxID=2802975 RepID=A0ABM8HLQ2_9BACT|nr:type VI secretion system ATPase TssH [Desulfuromonas versatilis]BCR03024.1 ClpV1 family T6SS ATPase [Desulfuromonas versatilis]